MGMLLHSAIYLQYKIMENIMVSSTTKKSVAPKWDKYSGNYYCNAF